MTVVDRPVLDISPALSPYDTATGGGVTAELGAVPSCSDGAPPRRHRRVHGSPQRIRILMLASNPRDTGRLAIDEEARAIAVQLGLSRDRDSFQLITCWAVRHREIVSHLNQTHPHIVHFSGHGSSKGEIVLTADDRTARPMSASALSAVFRTVRHEVRVVLLNACYTAEQARAINRHIDFVIGTPAPIRDEDATSFAATFYSSLGDGRTVLDAFDQAAAVLDLPESDAPRLLIRADANPSLFPAKPRLWARLRPVLLVSVLGAVVALSTLVLNHSGDPATAPDRVGRPCAPGATFDVLSAYDQRGLMGDTGDVTVQEEPDQGLVRFMYEAKGLGPHEWDFKFVDGLANPAPAKFGGAMLLDGNWGKTGGGCDLRGKRAVRWQARSSSGDANVEFVAGGVTWVWDHGRQVPAAYPDSLPRVPLGNRRLSDQWQTFEFSLDGVEDRSLAAVVGPFGWTVGWNSNKVTEDRPRTFVIEVRNITYESAGVRTP